MKRQSASRLDGSIENPVECDLDPAGRVQWRDIQLQSLLSFLIAFSLISQAMVGSIKGVHILAWYQKRNRRRDRYTRQSSDGS